MNRSTKLDTDLLRVESFDTTPAAVAYSLEAGTWNDATAGCCRPKPEEPFSPAGSNSICSFIYCQ